MPPTIEERVSALEQKLAEYEGSTEFLISQISGVHRRLIHFELKAEKRFDRLESGLADVRSELSEVRTRVGGLEAKVGGLEAKVDAIIPAIAKMFVEERNRKV